MDRAIAILYLLAKRGNAGVTEVAADLGVHKSTAFRLIAALEAGHLIEQDGERGKYHLGRGILRRGARLRGLAHGAGKVTELGCYFDPIISVTRSSVKSTTDLR